MAGTEAHRNDVDKGLLPAWLSRDLRVNWEVACYALIFLAAVFTRLYILDARVMSHDESLHTYFSYVFQQEGNFEHTPLMHGPLLFEVNALLYAVLGANDFTARIYPAVLGILLVLSPLLFRRWLGRETALIASILLLISPITLYYNRYIRHDTPVLFYSVILLWSILRYLEEQEPRQKRNRYLYVTAISLLLCFASKENTFIYIGIFASYLFLYGCFRVIQKSWNIPLRRTFQLLILAILLGTFAAIVMSGILAIAFEGTNSLAGRWQAITAGLGLLPSPDPSPSGSEGSNVQSFLLWSGLLWLGVSAMVIGPAIYVHRRTPLPWREIMLLSVLAFLVFAALVALESRSLEAIPQIAPSAESHLENYRVNFIPFYLAWVLTIMVAIGALLLKKRGFWRALRSFPEWDVLVLIVTFTIPWLSALLITAMGSSFTYGEEINAQVLADIARSAVEAIRILIPLNFPGYDETTLLFHNGTQLWQIALSLLPILPFFLIPIAIGLAWEAKLWLTLAAIYLGLYVILFTSFFTNIAGLGSGFVSSLGYWLGQQGVRRGSQPQYYYSGIILPLYEYLPIIGSFLAAVMGIGRFWRNGLRQKMNRIPQELQGIPWLALFAWWAVLAIYGYTFAGEKMPWLGIHLVFPLILLSACIFGAFLKTLDWESILTYGWLPLLLMPALTWSAWRTVNPILRGSGPFRGLTTLEIRHTTLWFGSVLFTLLVLGLFYRIGKQKGWFIIRQSSQLGLLIILCALTMRAAFSASYIHYDYAKEFLVYAHAAPQVKYVMDLLHEISERSANSKDLRMGYAGEGVSWPMEWYLRDFPNANYYGLEPDLNTLQQEDVLLLGANLHHQYGDILSLDYTTQKYLRLWWPNQDYFYLTPARINQLFDFSAGNPYSPQLRSGLLDIFWERDYARYFEAKGVSSAIQDWNPADHMYLYVRRDLASQIWLYEPAAVGSFNPPSTNGENSCPSQTTETQGTLQWADESLGYPAGLAVKNDRILIADEMNHQIRWYDKTGQLLAALGRFGEIDPAVDSPAFSQQPSTDLMLNRPNGVAFAAGGEILVADTWNYRFLRLDETGAVQQAWGEPFAYGANAPLEPLRGFWGPRDLVVDSAGNVYIADTGNKRIRAYSETGDHLLDIGESGSLPGQLEEPGSIALDDLNDELYIAEWWNQRVSVFSLAGEFLRSFAFPFSRQRGGVAAQVAVDPLRSLVYLSVPHQKQVVILDAAGNCLASLGPYETGLSGQFQNVTDVAVDERGNVWIVDHETKQMYQYPPHAQSPLVAPDS
ncbi:MAG: TIGR03663 family protein [Anaerolineaceae bacterium]|nr:TIGR03663 family protein [Anaerolineaceae bacterium]